MTCFCGFSEYLSYLYFEMINSDTECLEGKENMSLLFDGISRYLSGISDRDEILIKTSVTGRRNKNHEIRTKLLSEIIKHVREKYPHNRVYLCDGPAYEPLLSNEYNRLGWQKLIQQYDIDVFDLNYGEVIYIDGVWPVSKKWISAPKVINICKAKTHNRLGVTLASKNLIGTLSGSRMGYPKLYHQHKNLQRIMYSLLYCRKDMYNIIDGIKGVEGNGPMNGNIANSYFVVFGTNAFICDIRAMIEMGFHPAATQYAIVPINSKEKCFIDTISVNDYFCKIRKSNFDYLPNLSFPWMFKSLYYDEKRLISIYNALSEVTLSNWE